MVEADDAYTGLHSQDVVSLVLAVADELGMGQLSAVRPSSPRCSTTSAR
jgi:hypothetical protein